MHFWQTQPVFHIYNLKYWLKPPGTINKQPPPVNKFVNLSNNSLVKVPPPDISDSNSKKDISPNPLSIISQFIRDNYIIHDATSYKPSDQDILAYLQCSNQSAYFNVYREAALPFMPETSREIIGVTSARPLNVTLLKNKKPFTFSVYYVDNLCVKPGHRKKGIPPEMIQTFYYRMSRTNPNVNAYLFKREGQLNAIVPLVCYDTYAFDMTHFQAKTLLTADMKVVEVDTLLLNLFVAFMREQTPNFECVILPDVSNLLNLIKLGKIKVYGILSHGGGELLAVYVFRCLELYYDNKKAVECITILSADDIKKQTDILIAGFTMSWLKLKTVANCDIVFIEDTAHSKAVIRSLDKDPRVVRNFKSPTAFFLYNYAAYSIRNTKTMLLY
jgi:hypothetical protein